MVGESIMCLTCCNTPCQYLGSIRIFDTNTQVYKTLELGRCRNENCGALQASISYWDKNRKLLIKEKVKNKDIYSTLNYFNRLALAQSDNQNVAKGSLQNMTWLYQKNGHIYDFNGTRHYDRENKPVDCVSCSNSELL
jgi:hypothetical protein